MGDGNFTAHGRNLTNRLSVATGPCLGYLGRVTRATTGCHVHVGHAKSPLSKVRRVCRFSAKTLVIRINRKSPTLGFCDDSHFSQTTERTL